MWGGLIAPPGLEFDQTVVRFAVTVNHRLTLKALLAITGLDLEVSALGGIGAASGKDMLISEHIAGANVEGGTKRIVVISRCRLEHGRAQAPELLILGERHLEGAGVGIEFPLVFGITAIAGFTETRD